MVISPCRRKETTVQRRAASGPVNEGNGIRLPAGLVRSHPRPCGGVYGGRPSWDDVAIREERTIPDVLMNVQIYEISAWVCVKMHKHVNGTLLMQVRLKSDRVVTVLAA